MSLFEIGRPATAENCVIRINPRDNVAVARLLLSPGQRIRVDEREIHLGKAIPAGHKVAISPILRGDVVRRYGEAIGRAGDSIEPGDHVHTHNVIYEEPMLEYRFPEEDAGFDPPPESGPTFLGYPREDGRAGTRNYVAVMALSNCAAHTAELVARSFDGVNLPPGVDGVIAFPHGEGCGMGSTGPDVEQLQRTVAGILDHPNVSAAVLIGLGCEVNQVERYLGNDAARSRRLAGLTLQSSGGTRATVEEASRQVLRYTEKAAARAPCSSSSRAPVCPHARPTSSFGCA